LAATGSSSLGIRVDIYFLTVDAVFFGLKRLLSGFKPLRGNDAGKSVPTSTIPRRWA